MSQDKCEDCSHSNPEDLAQHRIDIDGEDFETITLCEPCRAEREAYAQWHVVCADCGRAIKAIDSVGDSGQDYCQDCAQKKIK